MLSCRNFYLQMKSEANPVKALQTIQSVLRPHQRVFIGCIDVNSPVIETAEEVSAFLQMAAGYIPVEQLGACDDCGFSPFADDLSTSRDIAFAKMKARIQGAKLASEKIF